MKFSKQLQYNCVIEWKTFYIDYPKLKKLLKRLHKKLRKESIVVEPDYKSIEKTPLNPKMRSDTEDEEAGDITSGAFFSMLEEELDKVNKFYMQQEERLLSEFQEICVVVPDINIIGDPEKHPFRRTLRDMYVALVELRNFVKLNFTGFRKITKKHDKLMGTDTMNDFMVRVSSQGFKTSTAVKNAITRIEDFFAQLFTEGSRGDAVAFLSEELRDFVVWERNTVWKDMLKQDRKVLSAKHHAHEVKFFALIGIVAFSLMVIAIPMPIFEHNWEAHKCLALLIMISMMWASESLPYFVTSLSVPLFVVIMDVLRKEDGSTYDPIQSSSLILHSIFGPVTMLMLGSFAITSAVSKQRIDKLVVELVMSRAGTSPNMVLIVTMGLGMFLSMWISNVASPMLCVSLIHPVIESLPSTSPYIRALLLGIAIACNIGGMLTPIASPQNAIALTIIEQIHGRADQSIEPVSFGQWIAITLPLGLLLLLISFLWIITLYPVSGVALSKAQFGTVRSIEPLDTKQKFTLVVTCSTILLWCVAPSFDNFMGDAGVIAIIPIIIFFGTGALVKEDFNNLPWNVVMFVGGGSALGKAIQMSGLLRIFAEFVSKDIHGTSIWFQTFAFCVLVTVFATFVSHTAAALIILNIVAEVGWDLGHPKLMVMAAALMCSGAMGLPISSFPNVFTVSVEDGVTGKSFLNTKDYLKTGLPLSVLTLILVCTMSYSIMYGFGF